MPNTLLLSPLDLQTFLQPCENSSVCPSHCFDFVLISYHLLLYIGEIYEQDIISKYKINTRPILNLK